MEFTKVKLSKYKTGIIKNNIKYQLKLKYKDIVNKRVIKIGTINLIKLSPEEIIEEYLSLHSSFI